MKNNRMTSDREKWLQKVSINTPACVCVCAFGTSRDNGRKRVPRLGPPTIRIALSPIVRKGKVKNVFELKKGANIILFENKSADLFKISCLAGCTGILHVLPFQGRIRCQSPNETTGNSLLRLE